MKCIDVKKLAGSYEAVKFHMSRTQYISKVHLEHICRGMAGTSTLSAPHITILVPM